MPLTSYKPERCPHCDQTLTYALGIDRGSVDILKAVARFIQRKGYNAVHPEKEMVAAGLMTTNQYTNLKRLTAHGLLAKVQGEKGNYCMTAKGLGFLSGEAFSKYAVIDKRDNRQIGYHEPEIKVKISDFNRAGEYWEGINYEIREGRVIPKVEPKKTDNQQTLL